MSRRHKAADGATPATTRLDEIVEADRAHARRERFLSVLFGERSRRV